MRKPTAVLAVTLLLSAVAMAGDGHGHHRHHSGGTGLETLQLNDGERWATDDSLRAGMGAIREAFEAAHERYDAGRFDAEAADALAATVQDRVNFMFTRCELPPAADAELHKLLAAALEAAAMLRERDADPHAGLHALHRVLDAYGAHFDHPGWEG